MEIRLLRSWLVKVDLADGADGCLAHFLCSTIYSRCV